MSIELRILSGARAGETQKFEQSTISIGRHPESDFRFDPAGDLDVSTKHAEVRRDNGRYTVVDAESTNGTFVNGERVSSRTPRVLRSGDVLAFGPEGPIVSVQIGGSAAVKRERRWPRMALVALAVAGVATAAVWMARRGSEQVLTAAQPAVTDESALEERKWAPIRDANNPAIVLIGSQIGAQMYEATGFSVRSSGLIVTSRHVVRNAAGGAMRIGVKFADRQEWHRAHIVRIDTDPSVDLALIQIDDAGPFPVVGAIAESTDAVAGGAIATLGFAPEIVIPLDGAGSAVAPRTTLTIGRVSKPPNRELLEIDAFASKGSSGSPVLDMHGHVIGVVYGGPKSSAGRVVYAVPSERVRQLVARAK